MMMMMITVGLTHPIHLN